MTQSNSHIQDIIMTYGLFLFDYSHELDVEENPNLTSEEAWTELGLRCNPEPL